MNYSSIVSFYAGKCQSPSTLATSGAPFWVTSNPDGTLTCFKFIKHLATISTLLGISRTPGKIQERSSRLHYQVVGMSNKIEQKHLIPLTVIYSRSSRVHAIVFQKLGKILNNFKLALANAMRQ